MTIDVKRVGKARRIELTFGPEVQGERGKKKIYFSSVGSVIACNIHLVGRGSWRDFLTWELCSARKVGNFVLSLEFGS